MLVEKALRGKCQDVVLVGVVVHGLVKRKIGKRDGKQLGCKLSASTKFIILHNVPLKGH